jgi:hypothetical protein
MTQPKHTIQSIDALINAVPEAQPINYKKPPVNTENIENNIENRQESVKKAPEVPETHEIEADIAEKPAIETKTPPTDETPDKTPENAASTANVQQNSETSATETDEYGNPVAKPKMYTEDEVQRMIRDRLKRGAFKDPQPMAQPTAQQVQQAEDSGFQYNENSELSWSQQLKQFVKSTMQEVKNEEFSKQQQVIQHQNQVEFESKFHAGMAKYPDFVQTMADKTITDDMVMAVRGLDNPAAFLYTAAKRLPGELERIAKIRDPYIQVAEMGRLHEKLAKKKPSSNAPRPLSQDRSDISEKAPAKVSIDHLIAEDAARKYKR